MNASTTQPQEGEIPEQYGEASEYPLGDVGSLGAQVTDATTIDVDTIIAQELNAMPAEERTAALDDIHGVGTVLEETEALIVASLGQLENELQLIPDKPAYTQAFVTDNGAYVCSRRFRLMFLRADSFNPKLAATRLVQFMEKKLEFFGPESLARTVLLEDLDTVSQRMVKSGLFQILPWRDRADRTVLVEALVPQISALPEDSGFVVKVLFYMVMTASEEEETQRRGLVAIFAYLSTFDDRLLDPDHHRRVGEAAQGMNLWVPVSIKCVHVCVRRDLTGLQPMTDLVRLLAGRSLRARVRLHIGSYQECCNSLSQYGIPRDSLPINLHGDKIKTANHTKWILRRTTRDMTIKGLERRIPHGEIQLSMRPSNFLTPPSDIELPTQRDILLGRGRTYYQYQGNVVMRQLVLDMIRTSGHNDRRQLAFEICRKLGQMGCRFLQKENSTGWWVEVPTSVAESRVEGYVSTELARIPGKAKGSKAEEASSRKAKK